jgi:3-hydroxyisobutyrate dehydrogenase
MDMRIGYIGLGALGSELARRLLPAHELTVWDVNPAATAAFEGSGARVALSAAQLGQQCDVVLTCLPRSSDVHALLFGPAGLAEALRPGTLLIDQTSGVPGQTRQIAQALAARGHSMMDAAVSASPHIVAQGNATLMASAPDEVFERALPVLKAITPTVYRCGTAVGDGQAMKMVNNAMNATVRLGTLEIVAMGRKAGLSLQCMTAVLNKSGARNQTTDKMLPAIAQGKASTNFALSLMVKDVNQAVALGIEVGVPMPVTSVARGLLQIGANTIGDQARLEDMIGLIESMAATRLRDAQQSVAPTTMAGDATDLKVGYVGLGAMGGALARRLMVSRKLRVFDVRDAIVRQLAAEGALPAPDLPSLARDCDVIMLCLPTSADVHDVIFGQGGLVEGLSAGKIVVDQTSADPEQTRRFATDLAVRGVTLIDAPVSGGPRGAAAGTIVIMAGGAAASYAQARSILESISPNLVHCGEVGNGHVTKLVNNAVSSLCRAVSYECLAAGVKYGLKLDVMAEVLSKSSGWSTGLHKVLAALLSGKPMANFQMRLMVKDLRLAAGLGASCGAPMMISNAVRALFETAANEFGGDANIEDLARLYEGMAGIRFAAGR